nr:tetratricopeptide repeat protein [uncultured Brevundimonas sp.]
MGAVEDARAILRALARATPDSADPMIRLGDLERSQHNWPAAIAAYREALDRAPKAGRPLWALYYSLGVALERDKQWNDAEQALLSALRLEPDQPLVLNYLGYSWIDRGVNIEKGKTLIVKAVEQRPTSGYIVDSLGWAHYLMGDYQSAAKELERAVELRPDDPTINDHFGDALWRAGRRLEAGFQWKRALDFDPEPELKKAIEGKLESGLPPLPEKQGGAGR